MQKKAWKNMKFHKFQGHSLSDQYPVLADAVYWSRKCQFGIGTSILCNSGSRQIVISVGPTEINPAQTAIVT